MWVVVPVKRFSNAKSRLATVLSEAERESLAQAMLHDVLRAASAARAVTGLLVISHEVRARYAVERSGGLYLEEEGSGLNSAVRQAGQWLSTHGQRGLLMLPGDVPLASSHEIDLVLEQHRGLPAITLVPDREQDGTNALAASPTDALGLAFGPGSFAAHRERAAAAGVPATVVHLPGLALDIDNPMDLRTLVTYDAETETLDYLSDSGIARRVMSRHQDESDPSAVAAASRLI